MGRERVFNLGIALVGVAVLLLVVGALAWPFGPLWLARVASGAGQVVAGVALVVALVDLRVRVGRRPAWRGMAVRWWAMAVALVVAGVVLMVVGRVPGAWGSGLLLIVTGGGAAWMGALRNAAGQVGDGVR